MSDITVIIPVYNVENYLKKCVHSVEAQTYEDYEIILVDDGSTDNSASLCNELAENNKKIKVIHQENKGLGGARNTGIRNCNTEYILFLDSDDYIHPRLLEQCIATAKANSCDMVLFDAVSVDESGLTGVVYSAPLPDNKILSEDEINIIPKNPTAWDKLYKTSLFKDNNIFFPEKVWYEDLRTIPKLILFAERIMKIKSEPMYYYLQRSNSIMHTPDFDRIVKERIAAINDLTDYYKRNNFYKKYFEVLNFITIYHAFLLPCLEMYRKAGNYKKYLNVLLENLKKNVREPLQNPYIGLLRKNEKAVLKLALKKRYFIIECLTVFNRLIKGAKNV
ncbi:MAG: glycosyltransferase family 2 protein [Acutalibacteraceae bacterium]